MPYTVTLDWAKAVGAIRASASAPSLNFMCSLEIRKEKGDELVAAPELVQAGGLRPSTDRLSNRWTDTATIQALQIFAKLMNLLSFAPFDRPLHGGDRV